jgi:uncharacterized protein
MERHGIHIPEEQIAEFCRRHRVRKLSVFGSFVRDDFGPESDIDVLVEFQPDAHVGMESLAMERELGGLLGGRKVEMRTCGSLSKYFRDQVLSEAEPGYVAA